GGVAVSGLEMSQNSLRLSWQSDDVDQKLKEIMRTIHLQCVQHGTEGGYVNYSKGANIAGFGKVADAVLAYGVSLEPVRLTIAVLRTRLHHPGLQHWPHASPGGFGHGKTGRQRQLFRLDCFDKPQAPIKAQRCCVMSQYAR